jgi:mevalonate kinase
VSLEVERRQHGSPSGVDNATVIQGGLLEARRTEDGVAFEPVTVRSPLLGSVRVFGTGSPAEGTGTVVAAVRALRDREPERVEAALDRLAELTGRLRRELESTTERPDEALAIFREAEARLEELGVVPAPVRELARRVEEAGGAAKISGAGALTCPGAGHGAGNLMIYHPEPERLAEWPFLAGLERYDVELGVPGARIEADTERVSP